MDISPDFRPSRVDSMIIQKLLQYEGTPQAITCFAEMADKLTDYGYWFIMGTLWVSYTGWSDLELWRRLFSSNRPKRKTSIMKPSELRTLDALPYDITAYRAHRPGEKDWISYTLDLITAAKFAARRGVNEISEYRLRKRDVIALFIRRGEQELIMLDPLRAKFIRRIQVIQKGDITDGKS